MTAICWISAGWDPRLQFNNLCRWFFCSLKFGNWWRNYKVGSTLPSVLSSCGTNLDLLLARSDSKGWEPVGGRKKIDIYWASTYLPGTVHKFSDLISMRTLWGKVSLFPFYKYGASTVPVLVEFPVTLLNLCKSEPLHLMSRNKGDNSVASPSFRCWHECCLYAWFTRLSELTGSLLGDHIYFGS